MTPDQMAVAARADTALAQRLGALVDEHRLADTGVVSEESIPKSMRRRRGFVPDEHDGLARLSLVRIDGILRWDYEPPADDPSPRRARRARRGDRLIGAEPIYSFSFRETPPNEVTAALEDLDKKLTPNQGLRVLKGNVLEKADDIAEAGRVLLLVHGTFSKSDMYLDEFAAVAAQNDLLKKALVKYKRILAFDHPTLSVSPWINALDLEMALARVTGPIDVICHSRGGLVVAWWLRNSKRNVENVVFVGTPLEGTSLASPARLRAALDMMANVVKAFEAISTATATVLPFTAPLTLAAAGLAKIVGGIVQVGASTPLADAAVAVVPGLMGQSRVGNNAEIGRLTRAPWVSTPKYYAVTSNFEPGPSPAPWWQFWTRFRALPMNLANRGADVIFDGANDLVVDTMSMSQLCGQAIPKAQILDFGTSPDVHHCNYFRQKKTVDFLARALAI